MSSEEKQPKVKKVINAADNLSLGISMVVAVLIGVGIGLLLKRWTGLDWTLWIGVVIGIAAAVSNVFKAYAAQKEELDKLSQDPRYKHYNKKQDDEDEDDY